MGSGRPGRGATYLRTSREIARGQRGELNSRQHVNMCALRGKGGLEEGRGKLGGGRDSRLLVFLFVGWRIL